ncbi:MAG TPA: DGQHR domain-containing protein [Rhizomicrobium sp.]|jgi:DGQHR domain-containing protein|nr:DGQHR domain-containing protein [Rhizomicrobium sp.]
MTNIKDLPNEDPRSIKFPCLTIEQPVGRLFIGTMSWKVLRAITYFDVRKLLDGERPLDEYLGIQRPVKPGRVIELQRYVNLKDACFPAGIIIAVEEESAEYDEQSKTLTLSNNMDAVDPEDRIFFSHIARVIDGQHRIAGLEGYNGERFDVAVTVLVGMDIADQGHIFATVNLAQTKVSPSLAYDLYDLAKTRSPQKTCHNIAVALNEHKASPFFYRIKRLGVATGQRLNETLTQATFIRALIPYISENPMVDRDLLKRRQSLARATAGDIRTLIFRNMFIDEKDLEIMDVVWNFFWAVGEKWPNAWNTFGKGNVLNRSSGFRALVRFLRPAYLHLTSPGHVPTKEAFFALIANVGLADNHFTVDEYKPGSSGEARLYHDLIAQSDIQA